MVVFQALSGFTPRPNRKRLPVVTAGAPERTRKLDHGTGLQFGRADLHQQNGCRNVSAQRTTRYPATSHMLNWISTVAISGESPPHNGEAT